jgi:hypothetical protein
MKKILSIIASALMLTSCGSDYLDTEPQASAGTATIFESTDNAKLAVNGICRLMVSQYLSSQGFNGEGTIKTYYANYPGNDFQKCGLTGWAVLINGTYHERSTTVYLYYPFYYYYKLIGNANAIVCNIDNASGEEAEKQFIKAQALTFRAYSYFMLTQLYCKRWVDSNNGATRGLPLRLDESTGDLAASTLAEVYAQVYADLDEAISLYNQSGKDRPSGDNYSPNIDVANAIYARAALTREDWANAAKYAALARAKYKLMSNDEYVDGGFNEPNSEWIWSSYCSDDQSLYFYAFFAYQGSNSSASISRTYPCAISRELIEQIPETDVRRSMYLIPQDGETYNTTSGLAASSTDLYKRAKSEYGSKIYSTGSVYAYMQFKMQASSQPGNGHINHFRSAEMYLTEAEADCHLGKDADAQALLVELNKTSGRNPSYECSLTGDALLKEVKLYRRFELWGEGFDWFDYKRWNEPISRKTFANGGSFHTQFAVTVNPQDENAWVWVYPSKEVDYNSEIKNTNE